MLSLYSEIQVENLLQVWVTSGYSYAEQRVREDEFTRHLLNVHDVSGSKR